ncbi:hypothetical protein [Mycoplasmoides alvi]|uniref:hypothetical protein n=1 Tax=Mycoplasmoides alvi TaxID=78580 RepID=UPI00051B9A6B|nr:hypothetical protein [Mycoplasmoides alvi]
MIWSNDALNKYLNNRKNQIKNFDKQYLVDKLFSISKNTSFVLINNHSSSNDALNLCFELLLKWFEVKKNNNDNLNITFCDPDASTDINENAKIFDFINSSDSSKKHVLVINKFETFKNIVWWIREFRKINKKTSLIVYFVLNEVGYLLKKIIKNFNVDCYILRSQSFNDFLQTNSKLRLSTDSYLKFLNQKISNFEKYENKSLANQLIKKTISIFWHNLGTIENIRSDVHSALEILRCVAFSKESLFDLNDLAKLLKIEIKEIHKILKIFEDTKIIRVLPIVSKNLSKVLSNVFYITFGDPIYYFAFKDAINDKNISLKLWVSSLLSSLDSFHKLKLVQDFYVSLSEQVSIYNHSNNSFFQIGMNDNTLGPLMTYMKSIKKLKKTNYFKTKELPLIISNYEYRNWRKIQIK